ncbi:DUF3604 domain-containing protein [Myxococcota bacterium]|nr:DUF3604 domain-containing protein [Myxococcota bacterium]
MIRKILWLFAILLVSAYALLYAVGSGVGQSEEHAGEPAAPVVDPARVEARGERVEAAAQAIGVPRPKQILFGDLHVHTTFSFDAFQMSLPMSGGDGAHPVADACDFARHCSALDFWSINDHAIALTPRRWRETVESVRQCNELVGNPANPDLVSFLGWEWTQVGTKPENHFGHKNVVLRDLEDGDIPTRPISAGSPPGMPSLDDTGVPTALIGALALAEWNGGGPEFARYQREMTEVRDCPPGVPVRELPLDCRETAPTPETLFEKLNDWNLASMVIPHGTSWGFYTPPGSSWDKQLTPAMHDPSQQYIVEVYSGHGNSEEYRSFREAVIGSDGQSTCPEPTGDFLPSCWRAGEIIEERCLDLDLGEAECAQRAATARQDYIDAFFNGGFSTVPGTQVSDWQDAGQCRDCFQPAFNYRPRNSVQYQLALGRPGAEGGADRFRFGFIAASDNHSARPGTGYKEFSRREFTEARFGNFVDTPLGNRDDRDPVAHSEPVGPGTLLSPFANFEAERQASFFLTGGLSAAHAEGRDRNAIWEAFQRREVYGTSGPRILLWFDLLNPPGSRGQSVPMGGEVKLAEAPIFQVRAVGSFEPKPGCPSDAASALGPEQLERMCQGECYHPSDRRRPITRLELVRIRPQVDAAEDVAPLIEDPWRVIECEPHSEGCVATFVDHDFVASGRDAVYYARAIEAPSAAVDVDPLHCERDDTGRCVSVSPCFSRPWDDDCLDPTEQRAWSSPIFVDQEVES